MFVLVIGYVLICKADYLIKLEFYGCRYDFKSDNWLIRINQQLYRTLLFCIVRFSINRQVSSILLVTYQS